MLRNALAISSLEFSEEDQRAMLQGVNDAVARNVEREIDILKQRVSALPLQRGRARMRVNRTAEPLA